MQIVLKVPGKLVADDNIFCLFLENIKLHISSESSARQTIRIESQSLFCLKQKKSKCRQLQLCL